MSSPSNVEYGDSTVALPNEILRSVVGSGVHGIAIAGTDDHDEMGLYIEPPEYILGTDRHRDDYIWRTQPEGVRSHHGDTDLALYSLAKNLRLAIKGNPTAMLPLFRTRGVTRRVPARERICAGHAPASCHSRRRRGSSATCPVTFLVAPWRGHGRRVRYDSVPLSKS